MSFPDSYRATCSRIAASMPRPMNENEFMFLSSQRVRKASSPRVRTETFASTRSVPFSISASLIPSSTIVCRSSWRNRRASSDERMSGCVTISSSGVPPRLKSTCDASAPTIRPVPPPTWTVLAASSSRCARTKPISRSPSASGTSSRPPEQSGRSYWEIWYPFGLSG